MFSNNRSSMIEIYRLLFAIMIAFSHANTLPWTRFQDVLFLSAWLAADFFFILSGYLMSRSVYKNIQVPIVSLGKETAGFLMRKIKSVYPTFIFALAAELIMEKLTGYNSGGMIYKIWDLLFLRTAGFQGDYITMAVGASWYLGALYTAMFILYPLARRYTDMYHYVIAPLTAIFIMGYFSKVYGHYAFALYFEHGVSLGIIRAIADTCLGGVSFILCRVVSHEFENKSKLSVKTALISLVEILSVGVILWVTLYHRKSLTDYICVFFIMVLITCSFSGKTYLSRLTSGMNVSWIGPFTLALYLNHYIWIRMWEALKIPIGFHDRLFWFFVLSISLSIVCVATVNLGKAMWRKWADGN